MKRTITCLAIVLLCAPSSFAQTKRSRRSAQSTGYYFTIGLCHACFYSGWHEDAIKWFRAKEIPAAIGGGYEASKGSSLAFAPIRAFKWDRSAVLWLTELYVGPFASEEAALRSLDDFPSVLAHVMEKRNAQGGGGPDVDRNERVRRTSGNYYEYGFFTLKGYRLLR